MHKLNHVSNPSPHFEPVQFTVMQASRGSFRALMLWTRANSQVMLMRGNTVPRRAADFARLVQEGNPSNTALVDAVLGKAAGDSLLGGEQYTLEARLNVFYAALDMPGAAGVQRLIQTIKDFQSGQVEREEVLRTLVGAVPAPTRLVHPRSLEEAWRLAEGVTLVMTLRRAVVRLIATLEGITRELGSAAERQYERQGVILLGQLELACAVADDYLRLQAEADDYDPDLVSASLVKAFAERSRRVGHPLPVREAPLGAGVMNEALDASRAAPEQVGRFMTHLGGGLADVGTAAGGASVGVGRLMWEASVAAVRRVWAFFHTHLAARVALVLVIVFLGVGAATPALRGVSRDVTVGIRDAAASQVANPQPRVPQPVSLPQIRVAIRTSGRDNLDDIAAYFGLSDGSAMSLLVWYNADTVNTLKARLPKGGLYSDPLPAGVVLGIPVMRVAATVDLGALADEFG
ncbi:MAG: hypothetical protein KIT87_13975, partial [Anaerolineae bacterium]|nr:hypothetical protein [Anaerolineae bacterium]